MVNSYMKPKRRNGWGHKYDCLPNE